MPQNPGRGYTATSYVLELGGKFAGWLSAVEGGEVFADVVLEKPPVAGRTKKHVGSPRYEPVAITFGLGMGQRLFEWVAKTLAGDQPARDGAVVFVNYQGQESMRLEFDDARITDIELPSLDAGDKGGVAWTVTFQPQSTALTFASAGSSYPNLAFGKGGKQAKWAASNFRFRLSGLEQACTKVTKVESLAVHQPLAAGEPPQVGALVVSVASASAEPFRDWHEDFVVDGKNDDSFERTGQIVLLSQDLQDELYRLELDNVGIVRVREERQEGPADVIARSAVELYVEAVELADAEVVDAAPPAAGSGGGADPGASELAEALRELVRSGRDVPREELIATRFAATAAGSPPVGELTSRGAGAAAGRAWARSRASREELESIAALEEGGWTELRLGEGHSLSAELRSAGTLAADLGAVDLTRDDFVEGLVAGVAAVSREAPSASLEGYGDRRPSPLATVDELGGDAATDLRQLLEQYQQVLQTLSDVSMSLHAIAQGVIRKLDA